MLKLPLQKHPPSALASAVPAGATPNADIGLRLEMVWNLLEDSEGYHSSSFDRGEASSATIDGVATSA
jgi:hypothetical protein